MSSSPEDQVGRHARLCSKLRPAFTLLLDGFEYAEGAGTEIWEFAVTIQDLQRLGLSEIDLGWLLRKKYVEHAQEVTVAGDSKREFRVIGSARFRKQTCFVLTQAGVNEARRLAADETTTVAVGNGAVRREGDTVEDSTPYWNRQTRELRVNGTIVKKFNWPAPNQQLVLDAFQEEGWTDRIDDPLPQIAERDAKRRLSDTIKSLNRNQSNLLIHFRGDGTGEGIVWEPLPGECDHDNRGCEHDC